MNQPLDHLYTLLPAIYRQRDGAAGEPLRALLAAVESELRVIETDINELYDNWFIETCDAWVVPYIGDLLSSQELYGGTSQVYGQQQRRAYVANTLAYRRRKGTATVLEQLVRDVTDWRSRAVEFYQLLAMTQNLDHVRPGVTTVDLRSERLAHQTNRLFERNLTTQVQQLLLRPRFANLYPAGSPFERHLAYTVEIREMGTFEQPATGGRYHNRHVGLFIWRLQSYPLERARARPVRGPVRGPVPSPEVELTGRYYTFDPLGYDQAPLFNQPKTETDILHLAEEFNVPASLRRPLLEQELRDRRQAQLQGLAIETAPYFGSNPVLQIFIDGLPQPISPEEIQIRSLRAADQPPGQDWLAVEPVEGSSSSSSGTCQTTSSPPPAVVAIDPETGRFAFLGSELPQKVEVSYLYGFSGDVGGGSYSREAVVDNALAQASVPEQEFALPISPLSWQVQQSTSADANPLAIATQAWNRTVLAWQALQEHTAIPLQKIVLPPNRVSRVTGDPKLPSRPSFQPGIVQGFDVDLSPCQTEITVYSGVAVDDQGRRIQLEQLLELDLQEYLQASRTSLEPIRLRIVASYIALAEQQPTSICIVPAVALEGFPPNRLISLAHLEVVDGRVELATDASVRSPFQPGIVAGLEVLTPQGRMEVVVTAGRAVDEQGRAIALIDPTAIDLRAYQGRRGALRLIRDRQMPLTQPTIIFVPAAATETPNPNQEAFHLAYLDIPQVEAALIPLARILTGLEVKPIPEALAIQVTAGTARDGWGKDFSFAGRDRLDLTDYRDQTVQLVLFTGGDRRYPRGQVQVIQPGAIERWVPSTNEEGTERDIETYLVLANLYLTANLVDQVVEPNSDELPPWLRPAGRIVQGLTVQPVAPGQPQSRIKIQPGQAIDGQQTSMRLEQACQFDLSAYAGRTLILFMTAQADQGLPGLERLTGSPAAPGYQLIGVVPEEPVEAETGVIVLADNGTYVGDVAILLPANRTLEILAATGFRPHLKGNLVVRGSPTLEDVLFNSLTLDGLLVEGQLQIRPGHLQQLQVRHCTLVGSTGGLVVEANSPSADETCEESCDRSIHLIAYCFWLIQQLLRLGAGLDHTSPQQNLAQLKQLAFRGFQQILTGLQQAIAGQWLLNAADEALDEEREDITGENDRLEITIQRTICGAITLAESIPKLSIEASVVDAYVAQPPAPGLKVALLAPGTDVTLLTSTVLGRVHTRSLSASDSLFTEKITTLRQQVGCIRFCHVPEGSRTPTRYRCQPQQTLVSTLSRLPDPITAIALLHPPHAEHPTIFTSTAGGGVFQLNPESQIWQAPNQQPANTTITALLAQPQAGSVKLWAGAADGSVFWTDTWNTEPDDPNKPNEANKTLWRSLELEAIHTKIMQFASADEVVIVATAGNGVLLLPDGGEGQVLTTQAPGTGTVSSTGTFLRGQGTDFTSLQVGDVINAAGQSRAVVRIEAGDRLTVDQPFRPDLPTGTVFTVNTGLTNPNITCLAIHQGQLWVGTEGSGVFWLEGTVTDALKTGVRSRWVEVSEGLTDGDITALAVDGNGQLFAGSEHDGVFRLLLGRDRWEPMGLTDTAITALAVDSRPEVEGAIASQHTDVIGTGTHFIEGLRVGDIITAMEQSRRVEEILTDQHLRVDSPFCPDLPAGTPFLRPHPLYVTTADGQLWRAIDSTTLEPVNINITGGADITALDIDPQTQRLWLGTLIGNLLQSDDQGKSWRTVHQGLPNVEEKLQIMNRLQPRFTSTQYGDPGYVQLSRGCARALYTGAEDEAEMGVFNLLKQPQRESSLASSLEEYLRFGLKAGIFYMT